MVNLCFWPKLVGVVRAGSEGPIDFMVKFNP